MNFDSLKSRIDYLIKDSKEESIRSIVKHKADKLHTNYSISIDSSSSSNFSIFTYPSSELDYTILKTIKDALTIVERYVEDIQNKVKTSSSSTFNSIITRFSEFVSNLEHISIKEDRGNITLYLIFSDIRYGMTEAEISTILQSKSIYIANAIHSLKGAGIVTSGEYEVSHTASNGQIVSYKYSLGRRLYAYIKVRYYVNKRSKGIPEVDSRIKRIYRSVVRREYKYMMGKSLDYQDFLTPTYEIDGISKVDFWYYLSEDLNLKIDDIAYSEFIKNKNYHTSLNEVLIFDFSEKSKYIRIDTVGEAR